MKLQELVESAMKHEKHSPSVDSVDYDPEVWERLPIWVRKMLQMIKN